MLADIGAGEGIVLKDAAKSFQTVNPDFPFTAYNTADSVEGEVRSFGSYSGQHFSPVFNKFIKSWPMKLEMPMISFFARADDYWRMKTVVHDDNINLSRMWIPMKWGEIDVAFPTRKTCNSCGRAKERSPPTAKTGGELAAGRRPEFSGSGEPSAPVDLRRAAH